MDIITFTLQQINKIIRYSLIGIINTCVTALIMYSLARLGIHFVIYTAIGYLGGMVCSFLLNLQITFQVNGYIKQRLTNFFLINLMNLFIVEIIEICLIIYYRIPHFQAETIAMIWYVFFGFIMNQWIVFRKNYSKRIYA